METTTLPSGPTSRWQFPCTTGRKEPPRRPYASDAERAQLAIGLSPINNVHVSLPAALLEVSVNVIVRYVVAGKLLELEAAGEGIRMDRLAGRQSVSCFASGDLKYILC